MTTKTGKGAAFTRADWLLLIILAAVQFTNVIDFVIVMPLGPKYRAELNLTPGQFGLVASIYGYCAAAAGLLAAIYMDRFDRKRSLLFLYGGFIVATFFCGFASNYALLVFGRGMAGAFGGIVGAVTMAIIGDAFHDSRRGRAMGTVMSAFSVASIIGIPIGLMLAENLGTWAPFTGIGLIATSVLIGAAIVMKPMRGHITRAEDGNHVGLWELFTTGRFLSAYGLIAAIMVSGFVLVPFMTTFLVSNVGLPESNLKYIYLCGGLATVVTTSIFGRLADRYGKLRMFRIVGTAVVLPILAFTNLPPKTSLAVVLSITTVYFVLSSGRMVPGMALIVGTAAPRYRGKFQSVIAIAQHLSMAAGGSLGGYIIGENEAKQLTNIEWVGVVALAFVVLSVVLAGRLRPAIVEGAPGSHAEPNTKAEVEADFHVEAMGV